MQKVILSILIVIIALGVSAQNESFRATVNTTKIAKAQTFDLTYSITNLKFSKQPQPNLPKGLKLLYGPSVGKQTFIANGVVTDTRTFSYRVQAMTEGKFSIPGATIDVGNGKLLKCNSITITVTKTSQKVDAISRDVKLRMVVDKTEVYKGEQVTATLKLYTRTMIRNANYVNPPEYGKFIIKDLNAPTSTVIETLNGVKYDVNYAQKKALFPNETGEVTIDPVIVEADVRVKSNKKNNDPFGFGFNSYELIRRQFVTPEKKIKVKPLPKDNVPVGFAGAVGKYTVTSEMDNTQGKTNEAMTLKVTVKGQGYISLVQLPELDLPENDFEVFGPTVKEKITKANGKYGGTKTFEYQIVPRNPGKFTINPIEFAHFDPSVGAYQAYRSPDYELSIEGEPVESALGSASRKNLNNNDIKYRPSDGSDLSQANDFFFGSSLFMGLYVTPFLLFGGLLLLKRRNDKAARNTQLMKQKGATKAAKKRLKVAKKLMDKGDIKEFYNEASKAMWGYLGDKLNIEPSLLSKEHVQQVLTNKEVSAEMSTATFDLIESCDMALFAGMANESDMAQTYDKAVDLISKLEDQLG